MAKFIKTKKNTVLVFGNFDLLHPGHKWFLRQAKKYGNKLIVVVTRDSVAKKIRGHKLAQNEKTRLRAIVALPYVHLALLGNKIVNHNFCLVKKIKPDVLILGHDQHWKIPQIKKKLAVAHIFPKIIRLKPYKRNLYRSSIYRTILIK